ncbi:MAG TPA: hotdog fold thioesterase [Puia sp.]|nr:hotdog fold thioesterase [Puia sp.]
MEGRLNKEGSAKTPREVLDAMLARDRFTAWMGLVIDEIGPGYCILHYRVEGAMLNGFESIHGGVLFAAADSAFAFACNSQGILSLALDVTINFTRPASVGDLLRVEAREVHPGNRIGVYDVRTTNENGELVALFRGTAYRTGKPVE